MKTKLPALSLAMALVSSYLYAAEPAPASAPAPAAGTSDIVAKVGDEVLTASEMESAVGMAIYDAQMQAYNAEKSWIERRAREILFVKASKDAKLSLAAWRQREIDSKIPAPTDAEVDQLIQQMARGQVPTDPAKLAEMKNQAKAYLLNQKRAGRENDVFQQLQAASPIQILLPRPAAPNVTLYGKDNPAKGPADAPVTIVEFTDFQCPWCSKSQETVHQVMNAYPGKIKFVTRNFPLTQIHPFAMGAAIAAVCVQEQGKFWEYHDKLFANQQQLKPEDLAKYAKELGVNMKKYEACLKSDKARAQVDKDQADGQLYGVTGTPTFFVNNQKVGFNQLMETTRAALETK